MRQDLHKQGPAGWWDGGAQTAGEGSLGLAWVCAHVAGHCQWVQHPEVPLFTQSHPTLVLLRAKQSRALHFQCCHSSLCSLSPPSTSCTHRIGPHDLGRQATGDTALGWEVGGYSP